MSQLQSTPVDTEAHRGCSIVVNITHVMHINVNTRISKNNIRALTIVHRTQVKELNPESIRLFVDTCDQRIYYTN